MSIRTIKDIKVNTRLLTAAIAAASLALIAAPANAREIERQQIGEVASSDQAPRTRTECIDRERGRTMADERWTACTEWRTQAQIYYARTYLVLNGPENVSRDDRRLASSCMTRAAAEAQGASDGNPNAESVIPAQAAFDRCTERANLTDPGRFRLSIEAVADWSSWR